ncbi:ABC transporter permease [Jiella pacifica]|uniref:ABC transporter permease subunit n=1 Tax=Jiella pacifica TaxID=2696469 RepID=A0A6N9SZC4_9HYPH|nr:ABC transporter permease [Jiella pacifica]NDW03702.1 ABC transporter permease subunit [Jiella pacifica]
MSHSNTAHDPATAEEESAIAGTSLLPRIAGRFGKTLFSLVVTLFGLLVVTFAIARLVPIDPALAVVGPRATQAQYEAVRAEMGLDRPIPVQFATYLGDVVRGDFGRSNLTARPVIEDVRAAFPATLELATLATVLGVLLGVPAGVVSAVNQGRWPDHVLRVVGLLGYSMPVFWLGLIALLIFYGQLGWVGGPGRLDVSYELSYELDVTAYTGSILIDSALSGAWDVFFNAITHIALPVFVLGYFSLAYISRMTRSFMLEQLGQEYVTAARVKGVPERRVVWVHALGNAMVPLITVIALSYAALLEGSVLTETVFAWPGLGLYITQALFAADLNAVLGGTVVIGVAFIVLNLLSDLLYTVVDPRAR